MKKIFWALGLALACASVNAKEKMIPLAEADAAALAGKTVALTVHERPSFTAMTAGKAGFGLLGAAAMISAGNKIIDENQIQDPAEIVRTQLAAALRDNHSVQLRDLDTVATKAKKPKELAALHPESDFVLDVRSGGWMFAYYPTRWGSYWVGYSVQVQLVDTKTGRQVSNVACNANTHENPNSPSREQLLGDGAKLLKDVTASLGWTCVQILAKEQFKWAPEQVAAIPVELVNPLASISTTPATDSPVASAEPEAGAQADTQTQEAAAAPLQDPAAAPATATETTTAPTEAGTVEAAEQPASDGSSEK